MRACVKLDTQPRCGNCNVGLSLPIFFALLSLAAQVHLTQALSKMKVEYEWDLITFRFDSEEQRQQLLDRGVFAVGESAPFDVDFDPVNKRVFLAMPHLLRGSVVTLATIENPEERRNPRLLPYPNMTWHGGLSGCDGLTSVFRVQVDKCGRLWVMDSGADMYLGTMNTVCPPQLFVFNLTTDEVIAHHRFTESDTSGVRPLTITIITEQMGDTCNDDIYAYITDGVGFSLFVYHLQTGRLWRLTNDYFLPDINVRFSVAGWRFTKMIGVLGLALSPCLDEGCDRHLFFHSFSGFLEGRVATSVLHNASLFAATSDAARPFVGVIGQRDWPAVGQAMSRDGILFFGHVGEYTINCWNMHTPYNPTYIEMVEFDYERIRVQMGVKVTTNSDGEEEVWSISNNIEAVFAFDFTPNNTYPIYIIRGKVNELIKGTRCDL